MENTTQDVSENTEVSSDVKVVTREFTDRLTAIDNEIESLKEDRKALIDEFSEKLDMKTLKAAMRVVKIESGVAHKDTYDSYVEVLKDNT